MAGRSGSVHERSRTEERGVRSQASELGDSSVQHAGLFDAVNLVVKEGMHDHRGTSGEFHQGNIAIQQNGQWHEKETEINNNQHWSLGEITVTVTKE